MIIYQPVISGSATITGSLTLTGSLFVKSNSSDIFIINNANNVPVLTISQSGLVIFATQSSEPTGSAVPGGIYFTSSSLFIGLE